MTNLELQIQELLSLAKNTQSAVTGLATGVQATTAPVDFAPVLDAIAKISVATPTVDFTPVLAAIAALDAKIGTPTDDPAAPETINAPSSAS